MTAPTPAARLRLTPEEARALERYEDWLTANGLSEHDDLNLARFLYVQYETRGLTHGGLKTLRVQIRRALNDTSDTNDVGHRLLTARLLSAVKRATGQRAVEPTPAVTAADIVDMLRELERRAQEPTPTSKTRLGALAAAFEAERHLHGNVDTVVWGPVRRAAPELLDEATRRLLTSDEQAVLLTLAHPAAARQVFWSTYLSVGMTLGLRHSDLTYLRYETLRRKADGWSVTQYLGKTSGAGARPQSHFIAHLDPHEDIACPACWTNRWVTLLKLGLGYKTGSLFPTWFIGHEHRRLQPLERHTARTYLASLWSTIRQTERPVSTRSLRVGHTTELDRAGFELDQIAELTGRSSVDELVRYIRCGTR